MYASLILLLGVTSLYAGYNLLVKVSSGHVPAVATTPILATIALQVAALAVSAAFAAGLVLRSGHVLAVSPAAVAWAVAAGLCIGAAEIGYFYLFRGVGGAQPMAANVANPDHRERRHRPHPVRVLARVPRALHLGSARRRGPGGGRGRDPLRRFRASRAGAVARTRPNGPPPPWAARRARPAAWCSYPGRLGDRAEYPPAASRPSPGGSSRTRKMFSFRRRTMLRHRLRALAAGECAPDSLHRLADIGRLKARDHLRGDERPGRAARFQREELRADLLRVAAGAYPPQLPHPDITVALDLAFVDVRDLDLDHQVGSGVFEVGVGLRFPFDDGGSIPPRTLADVEGAVRLHPRAGRLASAAEAGGEKPFRGATECLRGDVHDVHEYAGEIVMEARGGHEGDEPPHRVQAHPPEVPAPVDRGQLRDRVRVRAQGVDRRAERADGGRGGGGAAHGGFASGVNLLAARRQPPASSIPAPSPP